MLQSSLWRKVNLTLVLLFIKIFQYCANWAQCKTIFIYFNYHSESLFQLSKLCSPTNPTLAVNAWSSTDVLISCSKHAKRSLLDLSFQLSKISCIKKKNSYQNFSLTTKHFSYFGPLWLVPIMIFPWLYKMGFNLEGIFEPKNTVIKNSIWQKLQVKFSI